MTKFLHSATLAPNHKRTKPWRFKTFRGEEKAKLALEMQSIYKSTQPETLFLEKKYNDIGFKINKADTVVSIVVNFSGMVPEWKKSLRFQWRFRICILPVLQIISDVIGVLRKL